MKVESLIVEAIQNKKGENIDEILAFIESDSETIFKCHLSGDITIWHQGNQYFIYDNDYVAKRSDGKYEIVFVSEFEHYFQLAE